MGFLLVYFLSLVVIKQRVSFFHLDKVFQFDIFYLVVTQFLFHWNFYTFVVFSLIRPSIWKVKTENVLLCNIGNIVFFPVFFRKTCHLMSFKISLIFFPFCRCQLYLIGSDIHFHYNRPIVAEKITWDRLWTFNHVSL